eukprot:m.26182 g.26182  ORF g.26182 m.26182 type:complete len:307 (-) comp8914_c0_seq2:25-945(-)
MNPASVGVISGPAVWLGVDLGYKPVRGTISLLNRNKAGSPWFFIHDVLGDAQQYATMAYFCPYPIYGLGLASDSPLGNVDELVGCHIQNIRQVQPHGPYVIGGYSLGGFIAMKIVARLEAEGETVNKLLLVDVFGNEIHKHNLVNFDQPRTRAVYSGVRSFMPSAHTILMDQLIYSLQNCSLDTTYRLVCDLALQYPKHFDPSVIKNQKLLFSLVRSTHARWQGLFGSPVPAIQAPTWVVRASDEDRQALARWMGLPPASDIPQDLGVSSVCANVQGVRLLKGDHFGIFSAARIDDLVAALAEHMA